MCVCVCVCVCVWVCVCVCGLVYMQLSKPKFILLFYSIIIIFFLYKYNLFVVGGGECQELVELIKIKMILTETNTLPLNFTGMGSNLIKSFEKFQRLDV